MDIERVAIALGIVVVTVIVANVVDRLLRRQRRELPPAALTRYRALRRFVFVLILVVGLAMAAFVFPSVRGVAGGLLTSAAVIAVIIGIAARSSIGNFVSGLVIAFAQPLRIGDHIEFQGVAGVVEDVGRLYTRVRTQDGAWLQVPNDLLASDTIRNWTIVNPECTAEVRLFLPLSSDLGKALEMMLEEARAVPGTLAGREPAAQVSSLVADLGGTKAALSVDVWVPDHGAAEAVSSELRRRVQSRLRAAGVLAGTEA
jgi:small-conductance mechanosensitive channel